MYQPFENTLMRPNGSGEDLTTLLVTENSAPASGIGRAKECPSIQMPALQTLQALYGNCITTLNRMLQDLVGEKTLHSSMSALESVVRNTQILANAAIHTENIAHHALSISPSKALQSAKELFNSKRLSFLDWDDGRRRFGRALTALALHICDMLCQYTNAPFLSAPSDDVYDLFYAFEKDISDGRLMHLDTAYRVELIRLIHDVKQYAFDCALFEVQDLPPPVYTFHDDTIPWGQPRDAKFRLPTYCELPSETACQGLDAVISALDRSLNRTPRYNDQRVAPSDRRRKQMTPKISTTCESVIHDRQLKNGLLSQFYTSVPRILHVNAKNLESNPTLQRHKMLRFTNVLPKSLRRQEALKQRCTTSTCKKREAFLMELFGQLERLEGRRLTNQDAEPSRTHDKYSDMEKELVRILNHIHRTEWSHTNSQRAVFTKAAASARAV